MAINTNRNIYAVYKGGQYIMDGTIPEIARARGIKEKSVKFFLTLGILTEIRKSVYSAFGWMRAMYREGAEK